MSKFADYLEAIYQDGKVDNEIVLEQALAIVGDLEKELRAKQAEIDSLMLEYCPDEMTTEQLNTWGLNNRHLRGNNE